MTKTLTVLFILAFFVMSLGSVAFAAKAQTVSEGKQLVNQVPVPKMAAADYDGSVATTSGKPTTSLPTAMGYYMVNPGEVQIGSTEWDWMNPESPGRRVAIGSDGKIHTVFTYRMYGTESPTGADLYVYYNGYQANSTPSNPSGADMSGATGCFPSIAVAPGEALAIATYGYNKLGAGYDSRVRTAIGKQAIQFSPVFNMVDYPSSDPIMSRYLNCTNTKTGMDTLEGGYYYPRIAVDVNGSGQTIAHVLAGELAVRGLGPLGTPLTGSDTTGKRSLIYYRTPVDAGGPGSCGTFIDSTDVGRNWDIVAAPGTSQKVAAVYMQPLVWTGFDRYINNNDIYYKESSDLGVTWSTNRIPVLMPGKADSVVAGTRVFWQRATEFSALYDDNACLHVLYTTGWSEPIGNSYYPLRCRLYHWSSCNPTCLVMMVDGNGTFGSATGVTPDGEMLITNPSLTMCKVGAATRLYAVYTMYPDSSAIAGNTHRDYSTANIQNADIVVQGSTDMTGELWGPQVNITNTNSHGCDGALANCFSEDWSTSAIYVNDSLRIQYMVDKDAGHLAGRAPTTTEGVFTDNPMVIKTYPCFAVPSQAILTLTPTSVEYPFHTTPGGVKSIPVTMNNLGNQAAAYTTSIDYTPAGSWLSFVNASGTVLAGCTQTLAATLTATGPATEGFYRATITFSYTGGKTTTMRVDLYNYNTANWFVEGNNTINTAYVTMVTNQNSRVGNQKGGFKYVSDGGNLPDTAYIYDGGLIIGTSNQTMSTAALTDSSGTTMAGDTLLGRMYCLSNLTVDETGVTPQGYRHSSGKGCNKDSTIAFDVDFYAPKFIDSSHFMIGKFSLYSGPKNPDATINNVTVAYSADWDVPDDSSDNQGGFDAALQMVYQQGRMNPTRYGAMSGWRNDNLPLAGGWVLSNTHWIYRLSGYPSDTLWTLLQSTTTFGFGPGWRIDAPPLDTVADLNMILVFDKSATIKPKASGVFTVYVIYAGQPGHQAGYTGSLDGLKSQVARAKKFMCNWLSPNPALCAVGCNKCGDANSDDAIDIADAVFLITYIFKSGAAPGFCNYTNGKGDANGDLAVDIADAVYLITYIFKSGALPHCNGM